MAFPDISADEPLKLIQEAFFMLKLSKKQACAVALSAVFSLAVFSAPAFSAMALPTASSAAETENPFPDGIYTEPSAPAPSVSETPVEPSAPAPSTPAASTPDVSTPGGGAASLPPVASGEPGENVSGGITPLPDDTSSGAASDASSGSESSPSSGDVSAASSEEAPASSWQTVEPSYPSNQQPSVTNPDTDQGLIDQIASQAAQANSDPDVLTSQDWSELLSQAGGASSGEAGSEAGGAILPGDGTDDGTGGDSDGSSGNLTASTASSWLLPTGIVFIILALAGIGLFVYLQFILPRRRTALPDPLPGARTDPSVDDSFANPGYPGEGAQEDEGFVDVSTAATGHSYTGSPYDDDPYAEYAQARDQAAREAQGASQTAAAPEEQALANQETMELSAYDLEPRDIPSEEMEDLFSSDEAEQLVRSGGARQSQLPATDPQPAPQAPVKQAPVEQAPVEQAPAERTPAAPAQQPQEPPKAQATPVSPDAAKPFDWDKFFDE